MLSRNPHKLGWSGAIMSAAALAAWAVPAAQGALVVSFQNPSGTAVGNSETDYVLQVFNDGLNGTGTAITAVDVTIVTPGTLTDGALVIDLNADISSGGGDGTLDADVIGFPDGNNAVPTPTFGSGLGTFVGLPQLRTGTKVDTVISVADVEANGNVASYDSANGPVDAAFLNGTVHTLRVAEAFTGAFRGPIANVTPVPFANIVVPTGTPITAFGSIFGNVGDGQPFTISTNTSVPEPDSLATLLCGGLFLRRRRRNR